MNNHSNITDLDIMVSGNSGQLIKQAPVTAFVHETNHVSIPSSSMQDYWTAWKRGLRYILPAIAVFSSLMLAVALLTNNTYTSKSSIKIETDHTRILEYALDTSRPPSYINDDVFYNTQYKLLRNRDLARKVIDDLAIEKYLLEEKRFAAPVYLVTDKLKELAEQVKSLLPGSDKSEKPQDRITAEEIFFKNLTISPVRRSRVIDLHYTSQDPELSREILAEYIKTFIHLRHKDKIKYSEEAKKYLEEQLAESREKMQEAEQKLITYARNNKIVDTKADVSTIANNITLLNEAYIKAKSRRIDAESQYQNKRDISTLLNAESDPLIQAKKQELSSLQAEYRAKQSLFKPAYPEMQELKRQIDQLSSYINSESRNISSNTSQNMKANYIATLNEEQKLKGEINKLENDLLKFYENSIGYTSLKRDVDSSRNLYDGLLQRLKEIDVIGPVPGDNVTIVDSAELPPRKDGLSYSKYLLLGAFLGFVLYSLIILLKELFFPKIRNEKGLKSLSGKYPVLTSIPEIRKGWFGQNNLSTADALHPKTAEALRYLRTTLQLSTHTDKIPQTLHITSPNAGDGKSTIALFLATSLANSGKRVLVIDSDLRKPSIHKKLGLDNTQGLTNYIYHDELKAHKCTLKNSSVFFTTLTAGPAVVDPVDTLNTAQFAKILETSKRIFDHIIIDSPPVLGMADAVVLSKQADSTLLIVSNNITRKHDALLAMKQLEQGKGSIAGLICNKTDHSFSKNYYNTKYTDRRELIALPA
ncbi:MAG: polysaccharide biosynthesis tyrosine autokinase [Thiolinea sp.]